MGVHLGGHSHESPSSEEAEEGSSRGGSMGGGVDGTDEGVGTFVKTVGGAVVVIGTCKGGGESAEVETALESGIGVEEGSMDAGVAV